MKKTGCGCLIAIIAIILAYLFISGEILGKPGMINSIIRSITGK